MTEQWLELLFIDIAEDIPVKWNGPGFHKTLAASFSHQAICIKKGRLGMLNVGRTQDSEKIVR